MTASLVWVCRYAASALVVLALFATKSDAKTFRWANDGDPTTMDPHARSDGFVSSFDGNMYEPLLRRDRQMNLEPALATEWSNIDPLTWRLKLRRGVTFHDGTPLTIDDVLFSFKRAVTPGTDVASQLAMVKEIKKVDDSTIDFVTDVPTPILPNYLVAVAIMSKAWCEAHNSTLPTNIATNEETYATRNENGTGPFMLKDRQPGGAHRASQEPQLVGTPWSSANERGTLQIQSADRRRFVTQAPLSAALHAARLSARRRAVCTRSTAPAGVTTTP